MKLSFYIADKENKKARKFNYLEVDLLGIKHNADEQLLKNHIEKTINTLLSSVLQLKIQSDPYLKKQFIKQKTVQEKNVDTWD